MVQALIGAPRWLRPWERLAAPLIDSAAIFLFRSCGGNVSNGAGRGAGVARGGGPPIKRPSTTSTVTCMNMARSGSAELPVS